MSKKNIRPPGQKIWNYRAIIRLFTHREFCPACGSGQIRYSESWGEHFRRFFSGSRKRFCQSCGSKWSVQVAKSAVEMKKKVVWVVALALLLLLCLILFSIWDPKSAEDIENEEGPHVVTQIDKQATISA